MQQELWRVQLGNGEVQEMTLDALDAAFDQGVLNAQTPVLAPGATAWERLGVVAGLEEEAPPNSAMTPSLSPVAIGSLPPPPRVPHDLAALATPNAFGPALVDLDSLDDDALKPKRRTGAIIGALVATMALAAGGAFLVGKLGGSVSPQAATTTAQAAAPPPAATNLSADPNEKKAATLTDEQKKKLAEADKAREEKAKAAAAQKAREALPTKKAPKGKAPFVSGGNKYDPLNGAL